MGIDGFFKFVAKYAPNAIVKRKLLKYRGQRWAIDASLAIYQWCSIGTKHNIKNKDGKYINHIQGIFFRSVALINAGITPIYVFDGPAPKAKSHTITNRKMIVGRVKIPSGVYDECKKLLTLMGIPWIIAPGEAEAQAAWMTNMSIGGKKLADAVLTEDSDALVFGATRIVKNLDLAKMVVVEVNLQDILHNLDIDMRKFIDLCILLGSDYTEVVPKLGPKKALEAIRNIGSIDLIPNTNVPGFDYQTARKIFAHHVVNENIPLFDVDKLSAMGASKLRSYLIEIHGLNEKKVDNGLAKLCI